MADFFKIGIARGLRPDALLPALKAAWEGGFTHLEITMNTPGALEQIQRARAYFGDQVPLGAGTVMDVKSAEAALTAGAQFIVSPGFSLPVMELCRREGIPSFPGALSPTEVWAAWEAGALGVKIFPVSSLGGPAYIRALKGPYDQIPMVACGGISPQNLEQFVAAGASGIAVGGSLFLGSWIENQAWQEIRDYAASFKG